MIRKTLKALAKQRDSLQVERDQAAADAHQLHEQRRRTVGIAAAMRLERESLGASRVANDAAMRLIDLDKQAMALIRTQRVCYELRGLSDSEQEARRSLCAKLRAIYFRGGNS